MNERFETDEIPDESPSAGVSAASDSLSVDHLLNHLFQFSDLTYKFVMVCKDSVFQPHDYGTGELVTSIEAHVTSYIDEHPGCSPSELAAYWSRTNGFISQTLKKLEKKGFVLKSRGAEDGRRVYVQLTETGRRAEVAHRYFHRQMLKAVCQGVREEEKPVLLGAIRSLNEFFDKAVSQLSAQADQKGGMQP